MRDIYEHISATIKKIKFIRVQLFKKNEVAKANFPRLRDPQDGLKIIALIGADRERYVKLQPDRDQLIAAPYCTRVAITNKNIILDQGSDYW